MPVSITLQSDNLDLEALFTFRSKARASVITHPHPLYGGNMHNPVVTAIARAYENKGWSTLRFNFRGTGISQGSFSEGTGEQRDLQAGITYLADQGFSRIDLAGYSFGAWVMAHWSQSNADAGHRIYLVAPPVAFMDFSRIKTIPGLQAVFAGSRDPFCPLEQINTELTRWQSGARLRLIQGADHFFSLQIDLLSQKLSEVI